MKWSMIPALLVLAGCADEIPEDVSAEMDARRAATQEPVEDTTTGQARLEQLLESGPAGGYIDWVAEIRAGLDSVPADAAVDRGAALHSVQELYTRRFSYLVEFYGVGGAAHAGDALARAVDAAGARLQELMRSLADDQASREHIRAGVAAAQDALSEIETQARAAGLPPAAPRLPITTPD
jgi:hypothetical protein